MAKLIVDFDEGTQSIFTVGRETTSIGRSAENDIQIDHPSVSSRHALLTYRNGRFALTDLCSTNGTKVNGQYVKSLALVNSDRILFGKVRCCFEFPQKFVAIGVRPKKLLRITRDGKLLGYFSIENARENLARGRLLPSDQVSHDP